MFVSLKNMSSWWVRKSTFNLSEENQHTHKRFRWQEMSADVKSLSKVDQVIFEVTNIKQRL